MQTIPRRAFCRAAFALSATHAYGAGAVSARMPVGFISHGPQIPTPAERVTELHAWGETLPKPRGVLVMTPHFGSRKLGLGPTGRGVAWYSFPSSIKRRLPPHLEYPTPPSEGLARRVEQLLAGVEPIDRRTKPGFEHTTWMPLLYLLPQADVPVLELTYPYRTDAEIFQLGARFAPLRDEGILLLASGTMTHNLAVTNLGSVAEPSSVLPWGREFDLWAKERLLAQDVDSLLDWRRKAPSAELAHPDDGGHFRVLLFVLGAVLGHGGRASYVRFPVEGFESGQPKRCVEMA